MSVLAGGYYKSPPPERIPPGSNSTAAHAAIPVPAMPLNIYWGNEYPVEPALKDFPELVAERIDDPRRRAAEMVNQGLTIAWHQGRCEAGSRALGNRSILPSN